MQKREQFGKALTAARKEGRLPVVVYGPKELAISCFVNLAEFKKVWKVAGESSVVSLTIDGAGTKDVLIHDVDVHPVTGVPRHVDFYAIEAGKKVEVAVPLIFVGLAPVIKNLGATLVKVLYEIEIAALPKDLPHEISVDVSSLAALDSQIHARDLSLPIGVTLITGPFEVIAAVAEQKAEEEKLAAPADLSAIEVEKKGKQEDATHPVGDAAAPKSATGKRPEAGKK